MSRRNVLERINIPGPVNSTPEALEAWARSMTSLLTDTFQQFGYAINNLDILLEDGDLIDDRVATLIQDGTGLSWTYDDPNDMLTGDVSLAPFNTGNLSEGSNLYFTNERVDDRVNALIQNGTGLSWTYDDGANTLTGDVSLSSFDTDDLSEGASNLYYTDARVDARLDTNQTITGSWTINQPWDFNAVVDIRINGGNTHFGHNGQNNYLTSIVSSTLDGATWIREYDADAASYTNIARFETETIAFFNPVNIEGQTAWHAGNDGPTSGLDADTVDGYEGSELAVLAENNIFTRSQRIESSTENQSRLTLRNTSASGNDWIIASLDNGGWYLTAAGTGGAELQMGSDGGLFGRGASGSSQGLGTANFQQSYNNGNATLDSTDLAANGGTVPQTNTNETISGDWNITGTTYIKSALPILRMRETDASTDNKNWDIKVQGGRFSFVALNDSLNVIAPWLTADRTGTTITTVNFPNGTLKAGGNTVLNTSDLSSNGGNAGEVLTSDRTVTVGATGDYSSLQAAIDGELHWIPNGKRITVQIQSGTSLSSGILVKNGDYSHFRVEAVDASVSLASDFPDESNVIEGANARMPTLACVIDGGGTKGKNGYYMMNSTGAIAGSDYGVNNIGGTGTGEDRGAGLFVNSSSRCRASFSKFTGNRRNAWVTKSSLLDIETGNLSGSVGTDADDANLFVSRSSCVHCSGADLSGSNKLGIRGWRSKITGLNLDVTGCGGKALDLREGTEFVGRQSDYSNSGDGAMLVDRTSSADVKGSTFNSPGGRGIEARGASRIYAQSCTVDGGSNCVYAGELSVIDFEGGTAQNGSFDDLTVVNGGQINANGATTTSGTPAVGDTNVSSFNAIDGNKGIIWN